MNRKIEGVTWGIKLMQLPPSKRTPYFSNGLNSSSKKFL